MEPQSDHAPLVVVVGETASGKSSLALLLAKKFNGEIVSADSWTVYEGFDVGTAKPTSQERMAVPHHLIDVASPRTGFSAAEYQRLAKGAIEDITARKKLPILVGGTGLYVDSILYEYGFLPPATPEIRAQLNELTHVQLLQRVEQLDLDVAGIDLRNKRRLIRLIETNGQRPVRSPLRDNTLVLGLSVSREKLHERIAARTDAMFQNGIVEEVLRLSKDYGWGVEPMKGIGYHEFYAYFHGTQTLEETRNKIVSSTLNLAKRQRTWFKRNKIIHWISKQAEAVDLVTTFLNK